MAASRRMRHERLLRSFETPRKCAAPQDEAVSGWPGCVNPARLSEALRILRACDVPRHDAPWSPGLRPNRSLSGHRRIGWFGGLRAGKRLPERVDRAGKTSDLFGQPFCIGLLCGDEALETLQLILHRLQLVDGFLLRRLKALGLLKELLGCLRGAGLHLAERREAFLFRGVAGIGPPQPDRTRRKHHER